MLTVNVELADRSYPIFIGKELLEQPELLLPYIGKGKVLVVTNEVVAPLYLEKVQTALCSSGCDALVIPDGEQHKNLDTVIQIYDRLLAEKFDRSSTLIALGGGVVGDITGFAAATYQRGINFIQIPTTLLAQVDSSVGGKTGVNHPQGKNMIGAFYQPQCVLVDTSVLSTLPKREVKAGLAEVVKYGLINAADFFTWLEQHADGILQLDPELVSNVVKVCCEQKASIVAKDERESGVRALLNLGHTFGHAIETAMGYGTWLHGEAVAAGMVMAADLSMRMGWLDQSQALRIKSTLAKFGMPVAPPAAISTETYIDLMSSDKKAERGRIRFIVLRAIGEAFLQGDIDAKFVKQTLTAGDRLCLGDSA